MCSIFVVRGAAVQYEVQGSLERDKLQEVEVAWRLQWEEKGSWHIFSDQATVKRLFVKRFSSDKANKGRYVVLETLEYGWQGSAPQQLRLEVSRSIIGSALGDSYAHHAIYLGSRQFLGAFYGMGQ